MSYYFVAHIDIILEKYLWRGKMKNIKKLFFIFACLSLLVTFGHHKHFDSSASVSTCAILEEDVYAD